MKNFSYIKENILRFDWGHRGGGIEISLDNYGYPDGKMTAYQNYLGGGMLGSIQGACNIPMDDKLQQLNDDLKKWAFNEVFGDGIELYEDGPVNDFTAQQKMPASGY